MAGKTTYRWGDELEKVAEKLIKQHHPDLVNVEFVYIFRSKAQSAAGRTIPGKAHLVTGLVAFICGHLATAGAAGQVEGAPGPFFVLDVAEDIWKAMPPKRRLGLADHLLSCCQVKNKALAVRKPMAAEFPEVVKRQGFWNQELRDLVNAGTQLQLPMIEDPDQEPIRTEAEPAGGVDAGQELAAAVAV